MKRYFIYTNNREPAPIDEIHIDEDESGEWIKAVDYDGEKAAMCDSEHIAPVVRRVDIATARVIWRIFTGLSKIGVTLIVYGILVPLLIVTLILAMPYYALSKVSNVEIIDL